MFNIYCCHTCIEHLKIPCFNVKCIYYWIKKRSLLRFSRNTAFDYSISSCDIEIMTSCDQNYSYLITLISQKSNEYHFQSHLAWWNECAHSHLFGLKFKALACSIWHILKTTLILIKNLYWELTATINTCIQ